MPETRFTQCGLEPLTIERLEDGSVVILDARSKSVHSLNPSAAAVWDACRKSTQEEIEANVAERLGATSSEIVREALAQLQKANLIESSDPVSAEAIDLGRRSMLKRAGAAGAIAIPVVLTLTASEQKAYAFQSLSSTTTTLPPC